MKKIPFLLLFISISFIVHAQDYSLYLKKWLVQGQDTMPYRLLLPENYDPAKKYPIVFFLHGSGERGSDNEKQLAHGASLFIDSNNRKKFPAIIVFPQCSKYGYWSNVLRHFDDDLKGKYSFFFLQDVAPTKDMVLLSELVHYILAMYPVNSKQVYVGGLSMGGMGTFELVRRNPGLFAAAFAICGGAHPATAKQLKTTKWWIFHGGNDDIVDPSFSKRMVNALQKEKNPVKFSFYPTANHNSWDNAFAEPQLLSWLFGQRR